MFIMVYSVNVIILAFCYIASTSAYRRGIPGYWIEVRDEDLENYRQNGRTCEECHFPFSHEGDLYYGCRPHQEFEHACKNSSGIFIECPEICPLGTAYYLNIRATAGIDDNSIMLECRGWASPRPTITWRKDGEVVSVVQPSDDPYPTVENATYVLQYKESDYGLYSCEVHNGYSSDISDDDGVFKSYDFSGERLPTPPTNLTLLSQVRTYVTLGWSYDEKQPSSSKYSTSYSIHMTPPRLQAIGDTDFILIREKNFTIQHLKPGVKYTFKVKRINKHGSGQYSEPLSVTIPEDATPDSPVNLTVISVGSTTVSLEWDMDGVDKVCFYCRAHFTPGLDGANTSTTRFFEGNNRKLSGLVPGTEYTFEVEAILQHRFARKSESVTATTLQQAPSFRRLEVLDDDHNVVMLKCEVFGGPPPLITWMKNNQPITDSTFFNTTVDEGLVKSILTLPRNASVYTEYSCEASNSLGKEIYRKTVPYKDNHPPVALEQMIMKLSEDLKTIKQDLQDVKNRCGIN